MVNPFRRDDGQSGRPRIPDWYSPQTLRWMTPQQIAEYDQRMALYCERVIPRVPFLRLCGMRTQVVCELLGGPNDGGAK